MQISSIEQTKTTHIIRHLLLFVVLIVFSFSTLDKTNVNLNKTSYFDKLMKADLNFLENEHLYEKFSSKLENEDLESLENFNQTFTYKIIQKIYIKIKNPHYDNISMKEINKILDIIIKKISEISEHNIHNEFFNGSIIYLIGIYSSYKNNDFNFENFNQKIIPIINKIIYIENYEYNNVMFNMKKYNFINNCIKLFIILVKSNNFFFNLAKNIKLKELFIKTINEYISFEMDDNYMNYIFLIDNFLYFYGLDGINNDNYHGKVYFEIIDCFLEYYVKIYNYETLYNRSSLLMQIFLNILFLNKYYLKNITNLDILANTFEKIADIELNITRNEHKKISIFIIFFYTSVLPNYNVENNEKIEEIILIVETNIEKLLDKISTYKIKSQNYNFHKINYSVINQYLYHMNINFENDNFNNSKLAKKIQKTFENYLEKIVLFELGKIGYNITEIHKNYILKSFLSKDNKILENYNLKNKFNDEIIKIFKKFYKTPEDQEILENIYLINENKNFLEFVFFYEFIDINNLETRNLLLEFLKIDYEKFSKIAKNVEDFEIFIILCCTITNLVKKFNMDIIFENNLLEKLNKLLAFENEIQEFLNVHDEKDFKKLSIVKFINAIKKSKLKILENLEELNEENFKILMNNFIDNFRKLDVFYDTETNNNSEFRKIYNDFNNSIFYHKIMNDDNIPTFYWSKTEIRGEIYKYFEDIFFLNNSDSENKI